MDGDEIDRLIDLAVAQPVFPDVGIGDRDRTWALTARMLAARSVVVISPRSSTSLPTTRAVITPENSLARPTAVEICAWFFSRLLPSQMPWITLSPTLPASAGTWSRPFSTE